jgi:transcriptional regulator with XRE-family HTH domain
MKMATKLQELRLSSGLSQAQLAGKASLKVRTLQNYEQGGRNLDGAKLETLLKLCIAMDCKLIDLIEDEHCKELLKIANIK